MKTTFTTGITMGLLVGASLGALGAFGLAVALEDDEPLVVEVEGDSQPAPAGDCDPVDGPGEQERLDSCEDSLARLRAAYNRAGHQDDDQAAMVDMLEEMLIKSGGAAPEGTPMDFPEWLPPHQTPEGFSAAVDEIKRQCPRLLPDNARADCSEFPCMIVGESDKMPNWRAYRKCETWSRYFGDGPGMRSNKIRTGDEATYAVAMSPKVRDDEDRLQSHMDEYEGNLDKRADARRDAYFLEQLESRSRPACEEGGDSRACFRLGVALNDSDPERSRGYLDKSCELGHGNACNNLAWYRCHDDGQCDGEALSAAEQAAELRPWDGKGALDTLAFILCRQGHRARANAAYRKSCEAGYTQNCTKVCT